MSTLLKLLLAAAWLGLASGMVISRGMCPQPPVKQGFDLKRYMGKWWEYQRFPTIFNDGNLVCRSVNYTLLQNDVVRVVNAGKFRDYTVRQVPVLVEGSAKVVDPAIPSKLIVSIAGMPQGTTSAEPNYLVVDTDYDNYAVVYYCISIAPDNYVQSAWILTRAQGVKPAQFDAIITTLRNAGVYTTAFLTVDHSNC